MISTCNLVRSINEKVSSWTHYHISFVAFGYIPTVMFFNCTVPAFVVIHSAIETYQTGFICIIAFLNLFGWMYSCVLVNKMQSVTARSQGLTSTATNTHCIATDTNYQTKKQNLVNVRSTIACEWALLCIRHLFKKKPIAKWKSTVERGTTYAPGPIQVKSMLNSISFSSI